MVKSVFIIALSVFSLFGADIKWEKDLSSAVQQADKEHKPLMVLVTKNGCRWCDVFKQKTLQNPKVVSVINHDFVAYEGVVDEGSVPPSLMTQGTPATWFIKGRTPMFEPIMGAADIGDFLNALETVKQEYKNNATKK
jgi:thioredoxin-related protein